MIRFEGTRHMEAWLLRHPSGRLLMKEVQQQMSGSKSRDILILNYRDRSELYCEERLGVRQIDIPGPTGPLTSEFELAQERYAQRSVPWGFKDVLEPRYRRAVIRPCDLDVAEMLELEEYKQAFKRMVSHAYASE